MQDLHGRRSERGLPTMWSSELLCRLCKWNELLPYVSQGDTRQASYILVVNEFCFHVSGFYLNDDAYHFFGTFSVRKVQAKFEFCARLQLVESR